MLYEVITHNIAQVKINERIYRLMHRYLYEKFNDVTLNNNDMIIFLDGNKNNFQKDNLYKITRNINGIMKASNLYNVKTDKIAVIKYCEWKEKLMKAGKEE